LWSDCAAGCRPILSCQLGPSHWPIIRLVLLQDIQTGLALRPHWGRHHGPHAVSEQKLALQAIPHLPKQSVVIGDRNFGVFVIPGRPLSKVILHWCGSRASAPEALAGGPLTVPSEHRICWRHSRFDRVGSPFPQNASVSGHLVCIPNDDASHEEPTYFFTTLAAPVDSLRDLYRLRWNVETDLSSIKQTVRLQQISARSVAVLEKELLLALAAYNLVRAVICLAAEKARVAPRRLSFTNVYTLVETFLPELNAARTPKQWEAAWQRVISIATDYVLPNRSKPRSYPRASWRKASRNSRT
jgi:hypothetical protein